MEKENKREHKEGKKMRVVGRGSLAGGSQWSWQVTSRAFLNQLEFQQVRLCILLLHVKSDQIKPPIATYDADNARYFYLSP